MRKAGLFSALAFAYLSLVPRASADEDDDLVLLSETIEYTDVADAADENDPFDFNLTFGYRFTSWSGDLQRETFDVPSGTGDAGLRRQTFGAFEHTQHVLDLGIEFGIFRDFSLRVGMPVVLSDNRSLSVNDDFDNIVEAGSPEDWRDGSGDGNFTSPTRSGLDYLTLGLVWGAMNQHRNHDEPTWIFMGQARFPIGQLLTPCRDDGAPCPGIDGISSGAGLSDGTIGARFETRLSRRFRYFETYGGLGAEVFLPTRSDDLFEPGGDREGYQHVRPPILGEFDVGVTLIPWENRESHQRVGIDVRLEAQYRSKGRDFTPLFDALGRSSLADTVVCPDGTIPPAGGSCSFPDGTETEFYGLTAVSAHGNVGGRLGLEVLAAEYVRFSLASNFIYRAAHIITDDDQCNAGTDGESDSARVCAGPAPAPANSNGSPNPHYRAEIDRPGNRFTMAGSWRVDVMFSATAQF